MRPTSAFLMLLSGVASSSAVEIPEEFNVSVELRCQFLKSYVLGIESVFKGPISQSAGIVEYGPAIKGRSEKMILADRSGYYSGRESARDVKLRFRLYTDESAELRSDIRRKLEISEEVSRKLEELQKRKTALDKQLEELTEKLDDHDEK